MRTRLVIALLLAAPLAAFAATQQHVSYARGDSSYLSLELSSASQCVPALGPIKIAFPLKGGDGTIRETYRNTCNNAAGELDLSLQLARSGAGYQLLVTPKQGKPTPVQLALGHHAALKLDQLELDVNLSQYGG